MTTVAGKSKFANQNTAEQNEGNLRTVRGFFSSDPLCAVISVHRTNLFTS